MTLEVWATQTPLPTGSSGTTEFVHGTVTTTPNAVLHFVSHGSSVGVTGNQCKLGIGASDGTNDRAVAIGSQHNLATTQTHSRSTETACVTLAFDGGPAEDGGVSHNTFISGGQRVDNSNGFSNDYLCNSLFFACDNASLETFTLSASVDTATNVDPGFSWDAVIVFGVPMASPSTQQNAEISLGFFDKTNQGCLMWTSQDAQASGDPAAMVSQTYCGGEISLGTGTLDYGIEASVGAGTSCDFTTRNAGGDGDEFYALFLAFNNAQAKVFTWDSPTSTGSDAQTGVGFQPQALLNLHTFLAAYDVGEFDSDAGAIGVSIETSSDEFCISIADEDNSATTDTQSLANTQIDVELDNGGVGDQATLTSLDSDGFTHNYTAVEGTANKQLTLAFSVESGGITPQAMYHYRNHGKI